MRFVKEFLLKLGNKLGLLHKSTTVDMYTSIKELPTSIWWDINETHDYTKLLKSETDITQSIYDQCESMWDDIDQQHIDRFGISKAFQDYWREAKSLAKKKIKAALNGGSDESHYEYAQIRFDQMYKGKKSNNYKLKATIERILSIPRIDPDTMPIIEFSTLAELATEITENGRN